MIDFCGRVLTMDIEPGEPMGVVADSIYFDDTIPVFRTACVGSRARASLGFAPIKKPRFRGVFKDFSEPLRAEAELGFAEHDDGGLSKEKRPAADAAPGAIRSH
jgi:hypothetical protein